MSEDHKGVLVFNHLRNEGPSSLGKVLKDRGLRIRSIYTPFADLDEIDPLRPDLLVVMGGPIGVYQKDDYPFLKKEIEIVKRRIENDLPTIGICLGSQIIAAASGEEIYIGKAGRELGWHDLKLTDQGKERETHHFCDTRSPMFHWHGDTFDLPEGATLLASSEMYDNQIFEMGKNTLGIQCHPEVTQNQLNEWFVMFVNQITGDDAVIPLSKLRADTEKYIGTLEEQSHLFFNEWLENRGL